MTTSDETITKLTDLLETALLLATRDRAHHLARSIVAVLDAGQAEELIPAVAEIALQAEEEAATSDAMAEISAPPPAEDVAAEAPAEPAAVVEDQAAAEPEAPAAVNVEDPAAYHDRSADGFTPGA